METERFHVYMIRCMNGSLYTGHTSNLERRMNEHISGRGARYVRSFGFSKLVYSESFTTRSEAMRREYEIKRLSRVCKEELVKKDGMIHG